MVGKVNQPQKPHTFHRPRLHVRRSVTVELVSFVSENTPNGWHLGAGRPISVGEEDQHEGLYLCIRSVQDERGHDGGKVKRTGGHFGGRVRVSTLYTINGHSDAKISSTTFDDLIA